MSLVKKSANTPAGWRSLWSDFFDTEKFFADDFFRRDLFPAVNVQNNEKDYVVDVAVPGMKKEDFKLRVDNGILTISAEAKEEKEESEKNYSRKEFHYTSFSRSFQMPENADENAIQAQYSDGILKVVINKKSVSSSPSQEIKIS